MEHAHRIAHGVRGVGRQERNHSGALRGRVRRIVPLRNRIHRRNCRQGIGGSRISASAGEKVFDRAYRVRAGGAGLRRPQPVPAARRAFRKAGDARMITRKEAIDLYNSGEPSEIGMAADAVRRRLHPEGIVSYIIDRNINYTNFCTEFCSFCAFYRPMGHAEGYVHPKEVIFEKIQETIDLGGTGVLMQGGLHPELKIEWYEDMLRSIKQRFTIHLHCFSAPEITNIAKVSDLSLHDTLARLRA